MTRGRVLLALWGTAAALAALPWAIDQTERLVRRTPWRPPAIPHLRFSDITR